MNIKNIIKKILELISATSPVHLSTNIVKLSQSELLCGRNAIITGGSSGIGYAIADSMLNAGVRNVVITGRSEDKLFEVSNKLKKSHPGKEECIKYITMDLCDIPSFQDKFNCILKLINGNVDILVNNAGILGGFFGKTDEKEFDDVMQTNLKGAFFLTQIVAMYMKENKIEGNILNICSSSSLRPASSAYNLSKWGIRGLTLGLAKQLIPYGIVVNGLAPGPTATPMLLKDIEKSGIYHPKNPSHRYAMPEEIANMAIILTSGMGRMIVGDIIYMTGGAGLFTFDDVDYSF